MITDANPGLHFVNISFIHDNLDRHKAAYTNYVYRLLPALSFLRELKYIIYLMTTSRKPTGEMLKIISNDQSRFLFVRLFINNQPWRAYEI